MRRRWLLALMSMALAAQMGAAPARASEFDEASKAFEKGLDYLGCAVGIATFTGGGWALASIACVRVINRWWVE